MNTLGRKIFLCIIFMILIPSISIASEPLSAALGEYKKNSFSPSIGEEIVIPVTLSSLEKVKNIKIYIRTSDDDLVQTLKLNKFVHGTLSYDFRWNGKDMNNSLVADEVYHPILVITTEEKEIVVDSRKISGGEEVYNFEKNIRPGAIEYTLPVASRVLVRAGIKSGPMLRSIIDWEPRTAGFHVERWNGRDLDNLIAIEQKFKVGYLIVGYQLPKHSIITYGNKKETYRAYHERNKWPLKQTSYENRLLERNGSLIRPEFYQPVLQQKSPRIVTKILSKETRQPTSNVRKFDEFITEVKLHPLDEMYLDQERYEISFFVDDEFIAEEEQGFVPFTWRWSPGRLGIKPGKHVLTVNVSGYSGQVGVENIPFELLDIANETSTE